MVTDLIQIRLLGDKKRDENFRFRRYMKSHDHSDRILRRVAQQIEDQIDCTECANCCRVATATVTTRDAERLARYLRIPVARFLAEYTVEDAEEGRILRRSPETGCVFLDGAACTVYDARPDACQRFPHLVRGSGSIASRMWQLVDRASYCPIVYNSLETFKEKLGFRY
ncbi:MAG: YkgJ family cysteine cluster protein [Acidobacteriia bacterium]|nr:YkgJ family cysteine cluster protein [Terriglobia bacterium]